MNSLGLETSSSVCGVALVNDEGLEIERSIIEPHAHSEKLLTLLRDALVEASLALDDLSVIAVSLGPGSFTGLRIGLSTAKGLSYALEKPLVAVPTFHAIARTTLRHFPAARRILVVTDAKRGEYYAATYAAGDGLVTPEKEVSVLTTAQLPGAIEVGSETVVVTDREEEVRAALGSTPQYAAYEGMCRAVAVASLGMEKFLAKRFADVASLEPFYLKDFVIRPQPR